MCHFIALVTSGLEPDQVESILKKHGRASIPSRISSLQKVLHPDEQQYYTSNHECDSGTCLAHPDNPTFDTSKELGKLLKKGWSLAKAQRAIADKEEAALRNVGRTIDSYELWQEIIENLLATKGSRHVGLMLHFTTGDQNTDEFACPRQAVKLPHLHEVLTKLREDTLLLVSR